MIKSIHLTTRVRSVTDFDVLTKLLTALGLRSTGVEEYRDYRLQPFCPPFASSVEVVYRKDSHDYADLELTVSDPDSALEVIKKMGLKVVESSPGNAPSHTVQDFGVQLPDGTTLQFTGFRVRKQAEHIEGNLRASGRRFAVVVSRFNSFITERLLASAIDGLAQCGAERDKEIEIVRVPGAFEIPSAARTLAETRKYDAIVCIGCLLRGDTAHYDVIVNEVARGIGQSAQETGVPHAFGVLTCENLEQAIDRAGLKMGNKGFEAALAAVEMANLKAVISPQSSVVSKAVSSQLSALRKTQKSNPRVRRAKRETKR
jgi:6,7-dimethyl-8-ribityllumazine synthase